ncbi:MAG: hypothetical protein SFV53_03810 [Rickettsiales bacterium]|nr:hypothetical protein [Rickettsiales bacterium]
MKYLLILLALSACHSRYETTNRNCIYHAWKDGNHRCNRYRVVSAYPQQQAYYQNRQQFF